MTKEQQQQYIAALIYERDGYLRLGQKDRAAEVDAELNRVGFEAKAPHERAVKMDAPKRKPRAAKGK